MSSEAGVTYEGSPTAHRPRSARLSCPGGFNWMRHFCWCEQIRIRASKVITTEAHVTYEGSIDCVFEVAPPTARPTARDQHRLSCPGGFCACYFCRCEQIRKTQDEPQWIVTQRLLSHLQYLDSVKSSAKDLSLPRFEITISCKTFNGRSSSCATGPRPNACHVTMEAVDNTA